MAGEIGGEVFGSSVRTHGIYNASRITQSSKKVSERDIQYSDASGVDIGTRIIKRGRVDAWDGTSVAHVRFGYEISYP